MSSELEQLKSSLTGKEVINRNVLNNASALCSHMPPPAQLATLYYITVSQMHMPSRESLLLGREQLLWHCV